jgi:hypothetical protein
MVRIKNLSSASASSLNSSKSFSDILSPSLKSKGVSYKKYDIDLDPAASLIYAALMNPECEEVRNGIEEYLDHSRQSLNLSKLDKDLEKSLKTLTSPNKLKKLKQSGGAPLNICIIAGLSIVLISLSIYLFGIYAENVHYKMNCAQYSDLINPPSGKRVETILSAVYKMGRMAISKVQIDQCKRMDELRNQRFYNVIESVQNATSDLSAIVKTVGGVVIFLVLLFSKGLKALACLAAKYMNLEELCQINCEDIPMAKKASSPPKPAQEAQEEQEE